MSSENITRLQLCFGRQGTFTCDFPAEKVLHWHQPPAALENLPAQVQQALSTPLEFPPLARAVLPDDQITIALDQRTPGADQLVAGLWSVFAGQGVAPENLTIIQPLPDPAQPVTDPRSALPEEVRSQVHWKTHTPGKLAECGYLATSSGGQRLYLAREVVDADLVISVGVMAFDPLLGYRGTSSVFYPGLSSEEAGQKARGQGHPELSPDQERPLRQLMDEVGWLLGSQFSLQVISAGGNQVAHVLGGLSEAVFREGKRLLDEDWRVELDERPDMVVAAVPADAGGHSWKQIGAALEAARNLIAQDGKIILLTELEAETDTGLNMIRRSSDPEEALKPLRREQPPDLVPATQLINALGWANVYLLSRLPAEVVEELHMTPLADESEVRRQVETGSSVVFLGGAQQVHGQWIG